MSTTKDPALEPLADEELRRLEELEKAATPGEWRAGRSDMTSYDGNGGGPFKNVYTDDARAGVHKPTGEQLPYTVARGEGDECHENAQLIAALRNAAPKLLAMARENAELKAKLWTAEGLQHGIDDARQELSTARQQLAEAEARLEAVGKLQSELATEAGVRARRGNIIEANTFRYAAKQLESALPPQASSKGGEG